MLFFKKYFFEPIQFYNLVPYLAKPPRNWESRIWLAKTYPRVIGELRYVKRNFEVNLKRVETDKKVIISSFPYQPYTIAIRLLEAYLWVWIVKQF